MKHSTIKTYQIHYHNLIQARHFNPVSYQIASGDVPLTAPEPQPGYRFLGWYKSPADKYRITMIPHGSIGDLNLYARWEAVFCTLHYHANVPDDIEVINLPASIRIREGETFRISDCIPARQGYQFGGWNTIPGGSGTMYQPGTFLRSIKDDTDLYCQWSAQP